MAKTTAQQKRAAAKKKRRDARKKNKVAPQCPNVPPEEPLAVPVWEYGKLATVLMLKHPEQLDYHDVLAYLMTVPIYMARPGKKPNLGPPWELMAAGDATAEQFLDLMVELYETGYFKWDQDNLVHVLTRSPL